MTDDDKRVEAVRNAIERADWAARERYPASALPERQKYIARAALDAADRAAWRPISEAPEQTPVLVTAEVDGEWLPAGIAYHEPYDDLGWLCERTGERLARQPTHFRLVPAPPQSEEDTDASE